MVLWAPERVPDNEMKDESVPDLNTLGFQSETQYPSLPLCRYRNSLTIFLLLWIIPGPSLLSLSGQVAVWNMCSYFIITVPHVLIQFLFMLNVPMQLMPKPTLIYYQYLITFIFSDVLFFLFNRAAMSWDRSLVWKVWNIYRYAKLNIQ